MRLVGIERQNKLWANPDYRKNQIERLKSGKQTESFKKNQSKSQKKRFENPEERERATKLLRSLERARGEKSGGWRGGVSTENEKQRKSIQFRLWREAIFARDNWVCQDCFIRGKKLHPHHIKHFAKFPELRFAIDNGISLCVDCHKKKHIKKKDQAHFEG